MHALLKGTSLTIDVTHMGHHEGAKHIDLLVV